MFHVFKVSHIYYYRGSTEAVRQAHNLIVALIKDPDVDILQMLPKSAKQAVAAWDKSVVSIAVA